MLGLVFVALGSASLGCQDRKQGESRSSETAAQDQASQHTEQFRGGDLGEAQAELGSKVAKIMDSSAYHYGEWGYLEVDPSNGRTVRALGPADRLYIPGSATKPFSVSAALDDLGFDHRSTPRGKSRTIRLPETWCSWPKATSP